MVDAFHREKCIMSVFLASEVCRWRVYTVGRRLRWKWGLLHTRRGWPTPLTSVIGAGGRPWLRFPCICNYPKVFHPSERLANPCCLPAPLLHLCDLSRLNKPSHRDSTVQISKMNHGHCDCIIRLNLRNVKLRTLYIWSITVTVHTRIIKIPNDLFK